MVTQPPAFQPGDLVWLEFADASGHEQEGRRPAVVVSAGGYNARSSLILVCPVTSSDKPWPFKVKLAGETGGLDGYTLVDQVRAVDPDARHARKAGEVSGACLADIRARLAVVLGLSPES
ncbi:type II toxin-antitoxin system PemK/MazF family toxin [Glycocaulis sp.]|uniref:type II toxin-antitoxin system PemK/MazF family toxin n=1 Tax=Glycocaulis sp. TaxID=1969725 RepID=UPI003D210B38